MPSLVSRRWVLLLFLLQVLMPSLVSRCWVLEVTRMEVPGGGRGEQQRTISR